MHTRSPVLPAALAGFAFLLASCNSSGSSGGLGARTTGRLAGPVIAGLAYATPTQSGVTGADGSFQYLPGEAVSFALGPIAVGRAVPAAVELDVFDLVPGATPPTAGADVRRLLRQSGRIVPDVDLAPVYEACNLLAMLYSFDADKDAANGIQLPAGIDSVLQGRQIDFREGSARFMARQHPLRIAIFRAFALGLVATARRVHPFVALDRHWAALGQEPQLWTESREDYDDGNNGTVDAIDTWTIDARGFRVDHARDNDANGTRDRYETYEFNDDGEPLRTTNDGDGNGTIDSQRFQEWNVHGQLVQVLKDTDGGGLPDRIRRFVYDVDGNLVRREFDDDADGTLDRVESATFDAVGNLLQYESDDDANGAANRRETRTYDDRHNVLTVLVDGNADGIPEASERFEYDTAGNTTMRESDHDANGTPDFRVRLTWSVVGDMLVVADDFDADGNPDNIVWREYDGQHRVTRYQQDQGGNGTIDEVDTFRYVDDAFGNEILTEQDYGDNGTVNYRMAQSWGAEGQLIGQLFDVDGNGIYDYSATKVQVRMTLLGTLLGD